MGRGDCRPPDRGQQREQRLVGARADDARDGALRRRGRQLPPLRGGHPPARRRRPHLVPIQPRVVAHRAGARALLEGRARALPPHDRVLPVARRHPGRDAAALHDAAVVRRARRLGIARGRGAVLRVRRAGLHHPRRRRVGRHDERAEHAGGDHDRDAPPRGIRRPTGPAPPSRPTATRSRSRRTASS